MRRARPKLAARVERRRAVNAEAPQGGPMTRDTATRAARAEANAATRVIKKVAASQHGRRRWAAKYGGALVCVPLGAEPPPADRRGTHRRRRPILGQRTRLRGEFDISKTDRSACEAEQIERCLPIDMSRRSNSRLEASAEPTPAICRTSLP